MGQRSRTRAIAPWAGILLVAACFAVAAIIVYFYALLLVASLVVAFGANNSFTWHHYQVIFTEGLPAIRNTLIIAAIGMPLGGFYGVLVGYLIARRNFPGRRAMELVAMINYALPGTIVGIAYLIAFNDPPLALSGGALIIIACYISATARPASAPPWRCCSRSTAASRRRRRAWARAAARPSGG